MANSYDEKGNPIERNYFWLGLEGSLTAHSEDGLDRTKGEYAVSYSTLGGSVVGQYHFGDFFFHGGIGGMKLLGLRVNGTSIEMKNRTQWHIPVFLHAYYKIDELVAVGAGLTHLTETTMYLDGAKVPDSSYNQIFLDAALQLRPRLNERVRLTVTAIMGLNLIPGRQHTYSVGDLLHLRFQLNLGAVYALY